MEDKLFQLCKSVYEKTGWKTTISPSIPGWYVIADEHYDTIAVPKYTSDYLLEKLPKNVRDTYGVRVSGLKMEHASNGWYFFYGELGQDSEGYLSVGDTPLIALLRLALALQEAGELTKLKGEK